jgi:2-oxoglutarate dehydrogenase E2 component (dihydrolipoamide succinyltransferase)
VSVNAPAAGKITELLVNEEDTVTVGQDLFRFAPGEADESSDSAAASSEAAPQAEKSDAAEPKDAPPKQGPSPPPAQERKAEVKETSKPKPAPKDEGKQHTPSTPPSAAPAAAAGAALRNETRVKMSRMRLRIAERLKESQNTAAFLTTFNEIDMSSLMEMRKRYKDDVLKQHEVKLGFMSAFARACTLALKEIPAANASIEVSGPLFFLNSPPNPTPPYWCFPLQGEYVMI